MDDETDLKDHQISLSKDIITLSEDPNLTMSKIAKTKGI